MRSRAQTIAIILSKFKKRFGHGTAQSFASKTPRARERKKFTFEHNVTDAYSGQINGHIIAKDKDGHPLGAVEYSRYQDRAPQIDMITVRPEHRKKGVGAALVRQLRREFMQKPTFSSTTPDGEKLRIKTGSQHTSYDETHGFKSRGKPLGYKGEWGEDQYEGSHPRKTKRIAL